MQATEQRLLSFPFGSACSLNELSFNVFASFHSGSSRNPSRDEGTREERLLESWTAQVGSSSGSFGNDGQANMLQVLSNLILPRCSS